MHSDSVPDFIRTSFRNRSVRQPGRKRIWPALVLLAGCLLLTLAAGLMVKSFVEKDAGKEFDFACSELKNKISARLHTHAQLLRSGAAFFMDSDGITRDEWRNYYANQKVEKNIPGIQGVGYSVIIPPDQLALHEKKIQSEGFPQYSVRPAGKREIYTSIIYLEPFSGRNLRAFGYDMFSEPVRRKAMETARDYNIAALSGRITLVQETNEDIQAGVLMYVPVYKKGMPCETTEERRSAIKGWAYSPYRMNDMMAEVLGSYGNIKEKDIHLKIFDDSSYSPGALLYDSRKVINKHIISPSIFSLKTSVSFNNHQWYLLFMQHDSAVTGIDYSKVWYTAAGGTIVSILLFVVYLLLINTNIRAYELAEELTRELSESEQNYRTLADSGTALIWASGTDKLFNYFNRVWLEFTGRTPEQEAGNGWTEGVHPEDLHLCMNIYVSAFDRREKFSMDYRLRRHDGQYRWLQYDGCPSYNNAGEFTGYIGHCIDITERKETEAGLEKTRKELAAIKIIADEAGEFAENTIDAVREPLIVLDQKLRVVKAGRSFYNFFKVSPEETIGKLIYDLGNRQWDIPELRELLETILPGKTTFDNYEVEHDFSVIGKRIMLLNARQIQSKTEGKEKIILLAIEDITERIQSAKALQLRESYLSAIIENQPGMLWLKDQDGRVLVVNRRFSDAFGFDNPETLVGKTDIDLWPRELADKYIADDMRVMETRNTIMAEEQISDKEGDVKWLEIYKAPVTDNQGMVIGITGYSVDITKRKTSELELLRLNKDLQISKMHIEENLIQEQALVEELIATKEYLEKINSEKDRFFSIIAHDLKSPFQGFLGLTEAMAEDISSFSQYELSEVSREMYITAKNLFTLLNNLLEWARMRQGAISFNPAEIFLSETVSQNIDLIIKRGEQKGIGITCEIDQNLTVYADEAMLNTVLRNLLSNAVKFTRQGGRVTVKAGETVNNMVEIVVTDSGIGMSKDLSQKLFNMAEKTGRKGTDGESSTGLGLLLCKEFVERHSGRIWAESVEGKGTAFYFMLPVAEQSSPPIIE